MFELEGADIHPNLGNILIIFLIVLVTVPLAKALSVRYPVPGLSNLIAAI